jgi:hypothetical protein
MQESRQRVIRAKVGEVALKLVWSCFTTKRVSWEQRRQRFAAAPNALSGGWGREFEARCYGRDHDRGKLIALSLVGTDNDIPI